MTDHILHRVVDRGFRKLDHLLCRIGGQYENRYTVKTGFMGQGPEKEMVERENRLHLWWQNLNEGKRRGDPKGIPHYGRCSLYIRLDGQKPSSRVGFEWNLWNPRRLFSAGVQFMEGDHELLFRLGVWPSSFYLSFENALPKSLKDWWHKRYRYNGREVDLYATFDESVSGGINIVGSFWKNPMGDYDKQKGFKFFITLPGDIFDKLFGKMKYEMTVLEERDVKIPMPEGSYDGRAKIERATWKRPRLPFASHRRDSVSIDIDIGIPHQGKGESSWNCGEDALYGTGVEGHSIEKAIAEVVYAALNYRRKYDGNRDAVYPSPEERLAAVMARREASKGSNPGAAKTVG